jgi:hypothetical protein
VLGLDGIEDDLCGGELLRRIAADEADAGESCLWNGLVAVDTVNLLVAPPKAGKSTLLRGLLRAASAATEDKPASFLGRAVRPFRALVVSEEPCAAWADATDNVAVRFVHAPPIRKPAEWDEYVRGVERLTRSYRCNLVVFDTYTRVCAADENSGKATTRAMAPLRELASCGLTVLLVHHTNRAGGVRGSTALEANVDAVLKLDLGGADELDPRRVITSVSRLLPFSRLEYSRLPDGTLGVHGGDAKAKPTRKLTFGGK